MAEEYGATLEAWHHWAETLGLAADLLPVVARAGAKISPDSNMKALGKTPSRYNFRKEVAGFAKWTEHRSTFKEIGKWELEPDYGICVQARTVRAIDIDVPNKLKARAIEQVIANTLPTHAFTPRYRENTGKALLPFRYEGLMPKRVLPVDGGIVEFLGDGQQWVADSTYIHEGKPLGRYLWRGGWPKEFPLLTKTELEDLWETLKMFCGTEEDATIARERREGSGVDNRPNPGGDEIGNWLLDNWEIRENGREGELYIRCPFDSEHTSDSGPTETVYFAPGTGGYEKGHFKCLHAHCMSRDNSDYLDALGWSPDMSDAPELPALPEKGKEVSTEVEEKTAPRFITNKQGHKENRVYNHKLFLREPEMSGKQIAWDDFTAQIVWAPAFDKPGEERWRAWDDQHYAQVVEQMDRHGFVPQTAGTVRPAVYDVAKSRAVDIAVEWSKRLPEWDGVPRIETFLPTYLKAADTPYTRAVGRYMWTAQAGRLLDPGCQADMVPIFVSGQGVRKTSVVRAIAPNTDMFAEINLMQRDEDTSRKMRGKLVVELDELRGITGRAVEDVKSFITRRDEEWTPKYQEFTKKFKRRMVLYGTTNGEGFLGDATGERRWLPVRVGVGADWGAEEDEENAEEKSDVEGVVADRDQLWAEGIAVWRASGIAWQDAEQLAQAEHGQFKSEDTWLEHIVHWLLHDDGLTQGGAPVDRPYTWGVSDVLSGALGIPARDHKAADIMRVGKVLKALGATKKYIRGASGRQFKVSRERLEG